MLHSKSKILSDSVKTRWSAYGNKRNPELLERCYKAYMNLENFRLERERCLMYVYGDQWGDIINTKFGHITEKEYIQKQGSIPLVNNVIRSLVNSITGVYCKQETEPVCYARNRDNQESSDMMTNALQCNWQRTQMDDLLNTIFEEFVSSGLAIARESYEFRDDVDDSYSDLVNQNMIFFEGGSDPRHTDLSLIGQLYDVTFGELCSKFVKKEYGLTVEKLKDLSRPNTNYESFWGDESSYQQNEKFKKDNISFFSTTNPKKIRIYEIWTKENRPRYRCWDTNSGDIYKVEINELDKVNAENASRITQGLSLGMIQDDIPLIETEYYIDTFWWYQYLTVNGDVLCEGETPYYHKSHPYTLKMFPFVNGEIHSCVSTFIDQQRYINRLITLNDFILKTGAKGVTFMPTSLIPDNMTPEEFADQWTTINGLLLYTPKPGIKDSPQQFFSGERNAGINEMLQLQLQLIHDISNVSGALQGKSPESGTSAQRYSLEMQNATTSLASILKKFDTFSEDLARKKVKTQQQYYKDGRYIIVNGKPSKQVVYDERKVLDADFYVNVRNSASSPVYRMQMNDWLMNLWQNSGGLIQLQDILRYGDFPFADNLLQSLTERQNGQQVVDPNMIQQAGANQDTVNYLQNQLMQ